MKNLWIVLVLLGLLLAGCVSQGTDDSANTESSQVETTDDVNTSEESEGEEQEQADDESGLNRRTQGMGRHGPGGGMHARHHAPLPDEYAGLSSPLEITDEVLAAGEALYLDNCASCHGETGFGDGPAGASLDPPASALAHSGLMLSDSYLYYRIAEGGVEEPFSSAMPAWKAVFSEEETWQIIGYLRALGRGWVNPQASGRGPGAQLANTARIHEQMLEEAIERGLITEEEADTFNTVHHALDEGMLGRRGRGYGQGMEEIQGELLEELVAEGVLTEEQVQVFLHVHQVLEDAG